jgi:UPF0716 protein FxsA
MFALLLALFLLVPIVEITVLIQVGQVIGGWNTIALMILVSVVGAWLARHEGFVTWRRINEAARRGQVPGNEMIDGLLILVAGLMLLTPGFVTDLVAITVLFPPTRVLYRSIVRRRFRFTTIGFPGADGRGRRGPFDSDDVIDV